MTAPVHIRQIGAANVNLCGELGGPATFPAAATCGMCIAVCADGHTHDLNLTEVRMSDCEFGCKVWRRECCGEELVIHSATYGCPGGAA